jgi:hypothetical protein
MARRKATVARSEARSQRLRLRDPILVYVLQGGRDGFDRDDWALVCPTVLCCR